MISAMMGRRATRARKASGVRYRARNDGSVRGPITRGTPLSVVDHRRSVIAKLSGTDTTTTTAHAAAAAVTHASHAVMLATRTVECTTATAKMIVATSHTV